MFLKRIVLFLFYKDGKLLFETFKKVPEELEYDKKNFEIQSITTNPNGGAWARFTKKENPLIKLI